MQMQDKKLEVSAIENGTVIDHIPANALFKVISILNLVWKSDVVPAKIRNGFVNMPKRLWQSTFQKRC